MRVDQEEPIRGKVIFPKGKFNQEPQDWTQSSFCLQSRGTSAPHPLSGGPGHRGQQKARRLDSHQCESKPRCSLNTDAQSHRDKEVDGSVGDKEGFLEEVALEGDILNGWAWRWDCIPGTKNPREAVFPECGGSPPMTCLTSQIMCSSRVFLRT